MNALQLIFEPWAQTLKSIQKAISIRISRFSFNLIHCKCQKGQCDPLTCTFTRSDQLSCTFTRSDPLTCTIYTQ